MINMLPAPVLECILCLVPIQEAARTSILSKDWRYHWTKIPKLVFIEDEVQLSVNYDYDELFYAMNQVMSMHQGAIHEFSVYMHLSGRCLEMDNIIDRLSRNNSVKSLAPDMYDYLLPESLFSLHMLTDLYLRRCHLDVQPIFTGFCSLTNLYIESETTTKKMLILFLSRCPLLTMVNLDVSFRPMPSDDSTLVELLECLPLIEHLTLSESMLKYLCHGGRGVPIPKKLPAALVHLKYLCIKDTRGVYYQHRIACLAFLIRSSPNLEKLNLKIWADINLETTWEDYLDMRLEHLNEIQIEHRRSSNAFKFEFLKLMMAKSPVLKRVTILLRKIASRDVELKISRRFLRSRCASPVVQVIVECGLKYDYKPFFRM